MDFQACQKGSNGQHCFVDIWDGHSLMCYVDYLAGRNQPTFAGVKHSFLELK